MRATLYETLGVAQTASEEEIRSALRRLIRHYYAHARDGQGNVEEALRFVNYASRILGNPELRRHYDTELGYSAEGIDERRVEELVAQAAMYPDDTSSEVAGPDAQPAVPARPAHTALAETVGYFGRSRAVQGLLSAAVLIFVGTIAWLAFPAADVPALARNALVSVTTLLVAVAAIYGIVYVLWLRRRRAAAEAVPPQTDLAVYNWRREHTVFLGSEKPVEDSSWVFQLRMAELERARASRTSEPRPWRRLAARLFDYGVWSAALLGIAAGLRAVGVLGPEAERWVLHPLAIPVWVTATWVPIEALLGAYVGTTPGKWVFSVFLQFAISDAYAERGGAAELPRWARRALRVWWRGLALGIPFLAPFAMAYAAERLRREQETSWDADGDCLVTQAAPGTLNSITGATGLAATAWLMITVWVVPMVSYAVDLWERTAAAGTQAAGPASETMGSAAARSALQRLAPGTVPGAATAPAPASNATGGLSAAGAQSSASGPKAAAAPQGAPPATGTTVAESAAAAPAAVEPGAAAVLRRDQQLAAAMAQGRQALRAGNYGRAAEACETWSRIEPSNVEAWRCYGIALGGTGRHREAVSALRRAASLAPEDETLKTQIARSEEAMLAQFRSRYGGRPQ
jgi:Flp pilus assembly protein TadD